MFAYCINNPVNGCDPCGTCFHRWDFWNDCEKCGGRTFGEKIDNAVDRVSDYQQLQIENQNELSNIQRKLVRDSIESGLKRRAYIVQMQIEKQYRQDMIPFKFKKIYEDEPLKAIDHVCFLIDLGAVYCAYMMFAGVSIPATARLIIGAAGSASTGWGLYRDGEEIYNIIFDEGGE